ncbi:MAG: argininosuccinate synthase [Candidatus Omnitrophica bacterium]|nr:argininosuccinate synthase [Candidatus Omnitrophota bacterium]
MKKVVLAYSGGLDTACCVKWLSERGFEVVCFMADLGQPHNFSPAKKRAKIAGASRIYIRDLKQEFIRYFILPSLKANAIYEDKYTLATALGRPLIAKYLVDLAHKEKAQYIAHGCTGKGNDQVRIEVSSMILDPKLKIIAPLRIWEFKTREEEIKYLAKHKITIDVTKKKLYSIDENIWGVSIECGVLEDPWIESPDDAYRFTASLVGAKSKPIYLTIGFKAGIPVEINGKAYCAMDLIKKLNVIGGAFGIGRTDLVENRLIGIKSREIYEAPAAHLLIAAHKEIESLVLDRNTAHKKQKAALDYADIVYYGLWYTPQKNKLDNFINATQKKITGIVRLKLFKGGFACVGRKSPYSLYKKELATYGKGDKFDHSKAESFIKNWAKPYLK